MLQGFSSNYWALSWYKLPPYYVQLSISLYALCKYTKNWVFFFFGIVKPGKLLEPRGLTTTFFLSKLFHWKRIIRTRLTLYWNAFIFFGCGFFIIYVYCSWGLSIGFRSLRRRCFYSRQRRWFLGRQRRGAGLLEIICN